MVTREKLINMPVPKILNFLNEVKRTGILLVKQGEHWVKVFFKNGDIVDLDSSHFPELSLADFIRRRGLIPEDKLEEYINHARETGEKLGEYLVTRGLINPHDLAEMLNLHIVSKLLEISGWLEGEFVFEDAPVASSPYRFLNVNIASIIYQGIKDYLKLPRLPQEFWGRKEHVLYKRKSSRFRLDDLPMKSKDMRLYQLVDGTRTLRQLVFASQMPKRQAYMVLYALYLLGFVGFSEQPEVVVSSRTQAAERGDTAKREGGYDIKIDRRLLEEALAAVERKRAKVPAEVYAEEPMIEEEVTEEALSEKPVHPEAARSAPIEESYEREPWEVAPPPPPPPSISEPEISEPVEEEIERPRFEFIDTEAMAESLLPSEALARGKEFLDKERYAEALPLLRRASESDPDNVEAHTYFGWAKYLASGKTQADFRESEEIIKRALRRNPTNYLPYLYLGKLCSRAGDLDFAKIYFGKALELNPGCKEAKDELKRLYSGG